MKQLQEGGGGRRGEKRPAPEEPGLPLAKKINQQQPQQPLVLCICVLVNY
jgi:hypothetical protein